MSDLSRGLKVCVFLVFGSVLVACNPDTDWMGSQKGYQIEGDVGDLVDEWIDGSVSVVHRTYDENDEPDRIVLNETTTTDGTFTISGEIAEPTVVTIEVKVQGKTKGNTRAILEPSGQIQVLFENKIEGIIADGRGLHKTLISSWQFSPEYRNAVEAYSVVMEERLAEQAENEPPDGETGEVANVDLTETKVDKEETPTETVDDAAGFPTEESLVDTQVTPEDEEESKEEEKNEAVRLYEDIQKIKQSKLDEFAEQGNDSALALLAIELGALRDREKAITRLEEISSSLSTEIVESRIQPLIKRAIAYLKISSNNENLVIGDLAPDFTAPTLEGDEIALSAVVRENELVLLDFWASWCAPCIKTFPHLRELYSTYREHGFEIVSVSIDSTHQEWREKCDEEDIPWINLGDIAKSEGPVSTTYGVLFIPKGYVLDHTGKIIDKDVHTDDLEELLISRFETEVDSMQEKSSEDS